MRTHHGYIGCSRYPSSLFPWFFTSFWHDDQHCLSVADRCDRKILDETLLILKERKIVAPNLGTIRGRSRSHGATAELRDWCKTRSG